MVLPKAISQFQNDNLMQELLDHYLSEEKTLFPSDDWFDELWIHEPSRREKLRQIFSYLVEELDARVNEVSSLDFLRACGYVKAIYRNQSICLQALRA